MAIGNLAYADERMVDRDEVHHRVRAATGDGRSVPLLIVNISPHGMMARCDIDLAVGESLRLPLPLVGSIAGEVRWALGGRIGAQFARPIPLAAYYDLLASLLKKA
ncbi:PilZ domain-containing protein [Sphingomonas sp.]|uniref:PilZ domain-containing protein n=1 Tax=Sphingomonas sp. TaxID=28214 RepID=UPI002C140435|nr:PilZ domain-containing protein [Sphingomonas sp.]HWK36910.1 PilZ domain-containing protein [Sphingomonas sp.]